MKRIIINETQMKGKLRRKNNFMRSDENEGNVVNIDNFNWDNIEDSDDNEEEFYEELKRLSNEGSLAFQSIKNLYNEHPYALNNSERLKSNLDKIENIIKVIETMYEP